MFCSGRGKRGALVEKGKGSMVEKYCCDKFLMILFGGREIITKEDKSMVKHDVFLIKN
jgi:hypothetical protein